MSRDCKISSAGLRACPNGIGLSANSLGRWLAGLFGIVGIAGSALLAQPELQVGYALLEPSPGQPAPVAVGLFSLRNPDDILLSEAAVAASAPFLRGRIFVEGSVPTGLALANPFDQAAEIRLTLRDHEGKELSQKTIQLPARGHLARFVSEPELFGALEDSFVGSVTFQVTGAAGVGAVTIRQSSNGLGEPLLATLPVAVLPDSQPAAAGSVQGAAAGEVVFPHLGAGEGLSTQIVLINPFDQPIQGSLNLVAPDGGPLVLRLDDETGSTFPFQLAAQGVLTSELTSSEGVSSGYVVVRVEGGSPLPTGTAIFQFRDSEGRLISEAGVGAIPSTHRARFFVDTAGTQTGVAIANPSDEENDLEVHLFDRSGREIASTDRSLNPHGQMAVFAGQLFPQLPPGFTGVLEIHSDVPFVPITLKLTFNARNDPILTTLPVADLERAPGSGAQILSHLGFGAGISTRLILLGAESLAQSISGTIRFIKTDGSPLQTTLLGEAGSSFGYALSGAGASQLRPSDAATASRIIPDPLSPGLSEITLNLGNQSILRPLVVDSTGAFRDDFPLEFSSLDTTVATIDESGRVTAREAGFVTLTIQAGDALEAANLVVAEVKEGGSGFEVKGIAQDLSGRIFLTSSQSQVVLEADDLLAEPEVYAGILATGGFKDDARLDSLLRSPGSLALNQADGELYLSDTGNHAIREILPGPDGTVMTLAGNGSPGAVDGEGLTARFHSPRGIALDNQGELWVVDSGNHTIRRIDLESSEVHLLAGKPGQPGNQDGTGTAARFDHPVGLALEREPLAVQLAREMRGDPPPETRMLVSDTGNGTIRRVFESGRVETLNSGQEEPAGPGMGFSPTANPSGLAVDRFGNIFVSDAQSGEVFILTGEGSVGRAAETGTFDRPGDISITQAGTLLVSEQGVLSRQIRYGAPVIQKIEPSEVGVGGGGEVTVRGRNFAPETLVVVGSEVITDLVVEDSRTLHFTTPRLESGLTTLSLEHRGGIAQRAILIRPLLLDELPMGFLTTVAGGNDFVGDGLPATEAVLNDPEGLAQDDLGNIFISDTRHHRVRRLDAATGILFTVAGTGRLNQTEFTGDGGPAIAAGLGYPRGLDFDLDGSLLIADSYNDRIRRLESDGTIETVVGNGKMGGGGFGGDGGPALDAQLSSPFDILVDREGNYFISDTGNNRVRKVDRTTGLISTFAGNGCQPFFEDCQLGDDGPAVEATIDQPAGLALRVLLTLPFVPLSRSSSSPPQGIFNPPDNPGVLQDLIITDSFQDRLRRVDEDGKIVTEAGTGEPGFSGDGGPADEAKLAGPRDVAVNQSGAVVVADTSNDRIRIVNFGGSRIDTVAGGCNPMVDDDCEENGSGMATQAVLRDPAAVDVEGSGALLIADSGHNRIRRVSNDRIETIAGTGEPFFDPDGGPAAGASFPAPDGIVISDDGVLYVAETVDDVIWSIDLSTGIIRRFAGNGGHGSSGDGGNALEAELTLPHELALDANGNLYITEFSRVRRVDIQTGLITAAAGDGEFGFSGDGGPALDATFAFPGALAFNAEGDLFVADVVNRRVRRIDAVTQVIETVAGNGCDPFAEACQRGDGGPATEASLSPSGIDFAPDGALLIADAGHRRLRRVDPDTGLIETIAGNGLTDLVENVPATESGMSASDVAVDPEGNIWTVDFLNRRIRRIDSDTGIIRSIAGNGDFQSSPDGGPAIESSFGNPTNLAFDSLGNLFFSTREAANNRIRAVRLASPQ